MIPDEPSSFSNDPFADDSSDSLGCSELWYDESVDGPGYFTRGDFLDYYGHIDGAARWARAKVYDSDDDADGSDEGAGNAGGLDKDDDGAAFVAAPAAASALTFAVSSAIGASGASGASGAAPARVTPPLPGGLPRRSRFLLHRTCRASSRTYSRV